MQKNSGFSLIELLMVVALLGIIGGALFGTMANSRLGLDTASKLINRQQEARKAVDRMVNELKTSSPSWGVSEYEVDISPDGKRIDFYIPTFDGGLTKLSAVYYEVIQDPTSEYYKKLIRKQSSAISVLANDLDIDYLYEQPDGNPMFEFAKDDEGEIIEYIINIEVPMPSIIEDEDQRFILKAQVNLRNRATVLTGVEIE